MTIKILSDSETARHTYAKEVDQFLENGLVSANIPQGRPAFRRRDNAGTSTNTTMPDVSNSAVANSAEASEPIIPAPATSATTSTQSQTDDNLG